MSQSQITKKQGRRPQNDGTEAETETEAVAETSLQDTAVSEAAGRLVEEIETALEECRNTVTGCLDGTAEEDWAKINVAAGKYRQHEITEGEYSQFHDAFWAKWGEQYTTTCGGGLYKFA
jgi:hypothetical protein